LPFRIRSKLDLLLIGCWAQNSVLSLFILSVLIYEGQLVVERFLASLPFWMVLAFGAAWWSGRLLPAIWLEFTLLGIIGCSLVLGCRRRILENSASKILAALIGTWMAWSCVVNMWSFAPVCSWWKTASYLVAGGLCLTIATSRHAISEIIEILGSACCLTALIAVVIIWRYEGYIAGVEGGSFFWGFGFGHPNLLLNTIGLGCFSFFWWVVEHQAIGQPKSWSCRMLALLGMIAVITLVIWLQRRGVVVGIFSGLVLVAVRWCWTAHRRVAIAAISVIGTAMLLGAIWLSLNFLHLARAERMLLYGGMLEIASEHPLSGSGG
jgi:hypothetical protein